MPFVHVRYATTPSPEAEAALIRDVTAAVVTHLEVPPEVVAVVLEPVPSARWGVAGASLSARGI